MTEPFIQFKNVYKSFDDNNVLRGVDLEIYRGEITTVIGKSGGGKSVLLKHIIGLMLPDSGEILIEGQSLGSMRPRQRRLLRRKFSYIFQDSALFDFMTVFENIALPLEERHLFKASEIKTRVHAKMADLDLGGIDNDYPSQLSGGMKKRVALARALVTEPEVVLFDEPTTGLDPIRKGAVHNLIAEYQQKLGFTGIIISHEIPDVFFFSQRVAMLEEGRILYAGSPDQLQKVADPTVHAFIRGFSQTTQEKPTLALGNGWQQRFDEKMARLQSHGVPFVLVALTIENMDAIARQGSPLSAQQTVQTFADQVGRHLRITDTCSYIGGSTVLLLLPYTNADQAKLVCAKLRRQLKGSEIMGIKAQADTCLSVSAGFAEPMANEVPEQTLSLALTRKEIFFQFSIC